jgi:hypothetical protein
MDAPPNCGTSSGAKKSAISSRSNQMPRSASCVAVNGPVRTSGPSSCPGLLGRTSPCAMARRVPSPSALLRHASILPETRGGRSAPNSSWWCAMTGTARAGCISPPIPRHRFENSCALARAGEGVRSNPSDGGRALGSQGLAFFPGAVGRVLRRLATAVGGASPSALRRLVGETSAFVDASPVDDGADGAFLNTVCHERSSSKTTCRQAPSSVEESTTAVASRANSLSTGIHREMSPVVAANMRGTGFIS